MPEVVLKENKPEDQTVQHLPEVPPLFPNYHFAQQVRDTAKRLSMKSPNRIMDQPDRLTTTYRELEKPVILPTQSAANFKPGRLCEFYVTPGGNLLKKEQKFYETLDEATGQKKYQVYIEYNKLSEEETRLLKEYYEEQDLLDGRDKLPMFQSQPVPYQPEPDTLQALLEAPINHSRGYKVVAPHSNQKAMAMSLGLIPYSPDIHSPSGSVAFGGTRGTANTNMMIQTQQTSGPQSLGYSPVIVGNASASQPTDQSQLYELGGRYYLGTTTVDMDGTEYLVVDTKNFTVSELQAIAQQHAQAPVDPDEQARMLYEKKRGKMHGMMGESYPRLQQFKESN